VFNKEKDEQVCQFLETSFSEIFPGCKAHPFGSRMSGLAFPDSDLDVFLDTGSTVVLIMQRDSSEVFDSWETICEHL